MVLERISQRLRTRAPLHLKLRRTPLHAALRRQPVPLLDRDNRVVVSWSPRAACTHVVIWHLDRIGLWQEAQSYAPWPHRYRTEVYYRTRTYRHAVKRLDREGTDRWSLIKVVRDPARRCVSSYRHALSLGYADDDMQRVLGRRIDHREGFSYETFLEYLARIDLARCNPHHRLQIHPIDLFTYRRVDLIDIDARDLDTSLREIERSHEMAGAAVSGQSDSALERVARRHAARDREPGQTPELWRKPLTQSDTRAEVWPKAELEASSAAARKAREIYQRDYEMLAALAERSELV